MVSRNGIPEHYRAGRHVVLVRRAETVRICTCIADFAGRTVYHCHIFYSEGLGMMGIL